MRHIHSLENVILRQVWGEKGSFPPKIDKKGSDANWRPSLFRSGTASDIPVPPGEYHYVLAHILVTCRPLRGSAASSVPLQ
jgi:hypothetical protein